MVIFNILMGRQKLMMGERDRLRWLRTQVAQQISRLRQRRHCHPKRATNQQQSPKPRLHETPLSFSAALRHHSAACDNAGRK
jgi:hypothetical protein